ncbi:MAG: protein phosphatase 2C domain-containing protein [Thiogranum sp.]
MSDTTNLHWSSASRTHVGMVRKLNEDACLELAGLGIWAVADGMGGHAAGDFASQSVVEALAAIPKPASLGALVGEVHQRLQAVNQRLSEEAGKRREQVIGSTVVVLLTYGNHAVSVWAGDSRAYRYRQGELAQLTRDHSQVEELVAQGLITREQAEHHPSSNVITRAVGVANSLELDSDMFEVQEGDVFLLCSDGLYNEVNDPEIKQALAVGDCQYSCDLLVDRALARGARDNVTVVVVRTVDEGQITRTQLNPSTAAPRSEQTDDDPTVLK